MPQSSLRSPGKAAASDLLPGDLRDTIVFSAAIMAGAKHTAESQALVDFLRTPEAAAVIKAKGMEPAAP